MRLPEKLDRTAVLRVLLEARELLLRDGWVRDYADDRGRYRPRIDGEGWTLWNAIQTGRLDGYHARRVLEQIAGDELPRWNSHPQRDPHQVVHLVDRAIRAVGGVPPRTRYRQRRGHGGGWTVQLPRGETRPISSQGSASSGGADIVSASSGLDSFRPTGVPAMQSNPEELAPDLPPLLALAQDIEATYRHLLEQQRKIAELVTAMYASNGRANDPLGIVSASAEFANRLELSLYQVTTQARVARTLSQRPPAPEKSEGASNG